MALDLDVRVVEGGRLRPGQSEADDTACAAESCSAGQAYTLLLVCLVMLVTWLLILLDTLPQEKFAVLYTDFADFKYIDNVFGCAYGSSTLTQ